MGAYASLEENAVVKLGIGGGIFGGGALNGATVDTQGFSEALVVLAVGVAGAGTLDAKIQDSADGSSWADVTGAAFTQVTGTGDQSLQIARLKLDGNTVRRYVRAVTTTVTAVIDHAVVFVLSGNQYNPQTVNALVFTK